MRPRTNKHPGDRARRYLAACPKPTLVRRYEEAILRLSEESRLTDRAFEAAANAAIHYCEIARTSARPRAAQRSDRSWEAMSSAARKLKAALHALGDMGQFRLIAASSRTSFGLGINQRKA